MASIFLRISDVINANINDLIDKVEDPERMIKQIIREMEENISRSRESIVTAIASEKQLKRELDHHRSEVRRWEENAEKALKADREELAKETLGRKKEHERIVSGLEDSWEKASATSRRLKEQLKCLESKLAEARRKQGTLVARKRSAEARKQIDRTEQKLGRGFEIGNRFGRMESRILEMEAEAEAIEDLNSEGTDLDRKMEDLEREGEIDDELEALKKKVAAGRP